MNALALAIVQVSLIAFTAWIINYSDTLWFAFILAGLWLMRPVPKYSSPSDVEIKSKRKEVK